MTIHANYSVAAQVARAGRGGLTVVTKGKTSDNLMLPDAFREAMLAHYGGTRLGRQELDGELIEDVAGSLWPRALIEASRIGVDQLPILRRLVVAVDPPAGAGNGDACGIVAAGLGRDNVAYVIEDASVEGRGPEGWARAVAACALRHNPDRVVAEANNGGAMVESVLRAAAFDLPLRLVHASKGKSARAEPVAALFEAGRAKLVGGLAYGRVRWMSGANTGLESAVLAGNGAQITLREPPPFAVVAGERLELIAGCDKRLATCRAAYGNVANFRGEPHLPGNDLLTRYPGA